MQIKNHDEILPHTHDNASLQYDDKYGRECEEREHLCTDGGNINCCSHYGNQYGGSSENLELPSDPASPLLGFHAPKIENTYS